MEEHYIKDVGKITYVYGVNLEEHKTVIEKQQKRIAELEQDLEFTTKTANDLIEIKHKLEQDRDTWKRACELACEELSCSDNYGSKTYTIPPEEMPQYFYQQAKKEKESESK